MRPRWSNDHPLLAAVAAQVERDRTARDQRLLAAGKISADVAADRARISAAITRAWRAIADIAPEPNGLDDPATGGAWPFERRALLQATSATARAVADAGGNDFQAVGFADAVDTLLWWETEAPFPPRFLVDATIALRAQAAARSADDTLFTLGVAA